MNKRYSLTKSLFIFILAQLLWLALVGLWIYWYISNYLIFEEVGETISPHIIIEGPKFFPLLVD